MFDQKVAYSTQSNDSLFNSGQGIKVFIKSLNDIETRVFSPVTNKTFNESGKFAFMLSAHHQSKTITIQLKFRNYSDIYGEDNENWLTLTLNGSSIQSETGLPLTMTKSYTRRLPDIIRDKEYE